MPDQPTDQLLSDYSRVSRKLLKEVLRLKHEGLVLRRKLAMDLNDAQKKLEVFEYIVNQSHGVIGWHLNGAIATWEELGIKR